MKRWLCYIIFSLFFLQGFGQTITQGRYWLNGDFANATTIAINNESVDLNLNYSNLSIGYYQINFQFKQSDGLWSSPTTDWFYKGNSGLSTSGYRYWFNNDFAKAVTVNSSIDSLNLNLICDSLTNGYYQANFQFEDNSGKWSSIISGWFYKTKSNKQLVKACRYWFDDNTANMKTIVMQSATYDPIITNMDVESLSLGPHYVNIQFQDDGGVWSSIVTDLINRNPITSKIFIEPKVYVQKSSVAPGDIQTITGKDFTSSGQINLSVQTSTGDFIQTNSSFTYLPNGSFSYQLPITSSMPGGEYQVYATDINTGSTSPVIKFKVNNTITQKLWISEPSSSGSYVTNSPVNINWSDFVTATNAIGKTGFVKKKYKIEYSNDNGSTWNIIESLHIESGQSNQIDPFHTSYIFSTAGNYLIKVTDLDNLSDYNTTSFVVGSSTTNGFITSLEWDHSIPVRKDNPVGLAADGTARIFIKLKREVGNIKPVKEIDAQISPNGSDHSSGAELLGKIMYANDTSNYSIEGNGAVNTFDNKTFSSSLANSFAFWFVAPDDFTQQLDNQDAERTVKISFNIIYSDNSFIPEEEIVRIVRPPLMMVHGLNGSAESFANTRYNVDGTTRYFKYAGGSDELFKNSFMILNLKSYASFKDNADILLGIGDIAYRPQSFQRFINQMDIQGFAANRVDYVCHSMGGCIARTVMSDQYNSYFKPDVQSSLSYKNYGKGFINKLITLNTPHNGSPIADFVCDLFNNIAIPSFLESNQNLGGFFVKTSSDKILSYYTPSPAIKDLRAVNGGVRFNATNVKNHLIGGDIDRYNVPDANLLVALNGTSEIKDILDLADILLPGSREDADGIIDGLNAYISLRYGYPNYLSNSDVVVPVTSQFPSLIEDNIPDIDISSILPNTATVGYGVTRNHVQITDDPTVGTEIMYLLNAPIETSAGYFAGQISGNSNGGGIIYAPNKIDNINAIQDSTINYTSTDRIQILYPSHYSTVYVDSTVNINLLVKDTNNLQKIQMVFQGEYYESYSKISNQTFNVKIHSNAIGYNQIVAQGLYDSSGYTIYHTDTATLRISSLDTLKSFYITPKTQNLNRNQTFEPVYSAVYTNYIGVLNDNVDSLSFTIADTNVVKYIDSLREFTTKDTGTTYIVFNYKGFIDTAFIYLTMPVIPDVQNVCPGGNTLFISDASGSSYQWQVDTGNGYTNISNNAIYSGATTDSLELINPPTSWYGYKYQCIVSGSGDPIIGSLSILRFADTWTGVSDSAWENVANWSCGNLPDSNTDVIISSGVSKIPNVSSNASCRSLTLNAGAMIKVKTGYKLTIAGKNE
jgi:hypothetical protein